MGAAAVIRRVALGTRTIHEVVGRAHFNVLQRLAMVHPDDLPARRVCQELVFQIQQKVASAISSVV